MIFHLILLFFFFFCNLKNIVKFKHFNYYLKIVYNQSAYFVTVYSSKSLLQMHFYYFYLDDLVFLSSETPVEKIPVNDTEKLLLRLGLSERRPAPDVVQFTESDPLGEKLVAVHASDDLVSSLCKLLLLLLL